MDYRKRYLVFFSLDSVIVLFAIYISYWLLHPTVSLYSNKMIFISAITFISSTSYSRYLYQLYARVWAVASVK